MAAKKAFWKYLPGNQWLFGRDAKRRRVEALRRAYGDNCWRCGHPMSFSPLATRRRASVEHLVARAHGGKSEWQNIRLCHPGCNRHLGIHPVDRKLRMRLSLARERVVEFVQKAGPGSGPG